MATNFDYEYARALKMYEDAKTNDEKLKALEEMKRTAPSHKGAEKLRLDVSKKLSKLKTQIEKESSRKSSGRSMMVKKEGAMQICVLGFPNSGKSSLLKYITNANPIVASYEFSTTEPEIGVLDHKGAKIQVVELPAIIEGSHLGKARGREIISVSRNADFLIFTFIGDEKVVKEQLDVLLYELESSGIYVNLPKPKIYLKKSGAKGIEIVNPHYLKCDQSTAKELIRDRGYYAATLTLEQEADIDDIEKALDNSLVFKNAIGIWIYSDRDLEYNNLKIYSTNLNDDIADKIYSHLDLILVYTRSSQKDSKDNEPIVLKRGDTVLDLCQILHKDFVEKFNSARIWGSSKFAGQIVSKDYKLENGDIIEIYTKK